VRTNGIGDVARGKVRIVLFSHPRVGMAKLFGNHAHRQAAHGQGRAMRVSKYVKGNGGLDIRAIAGVQGQEFFPGL
jgi:hypothetical protein